MCHRTLCPSGERDRVAPTARHSHRAQAVRERLGVGMQRGGSDAKSAGDALIGISYDASPGNGATAWSIGEFAAFTDTVPPLSGNPRLDVSAIDSVVRSFPEGNPVGAKLDVTVRSDRPVSLSAEIIGDAAEGEACVLAPSTPYSSATLSTTHGFTFGDLCLFESYRVQFTGLDAEGSPVSLFDRNTRDWVGTSVVLQTPALSLRMVGTLGVNPPMDGDWHFVRIDNLVVTPDLEGSDAERRSRVAGPTELDWLRIPAGSSDVTSRGWFVLRPYGSRAFACGSPEAEPLSLGGPFWVTDVGNNDVDVAVRVEIRRGGSPPAGAVAGRCSLGTLIELVDIRATVSLAELFRGVELTSESGAVTLRVRATAFETR